MSDLFTRLVSGPVSPTAPIVPRMPSRTEPAQLEETSVQSFASRVQAPASISVAEPPRWRAADPRPMLPPAISAPARAERRQETQPQAPPVPGRAQPEPDRPAPAARPALSRTEREVVTFNLSYMDREVVERVRPATPSEPRRAPRAKAPERQTVQISIGRIEIRAPQPQSFTPAAVFEPAPAAADPGDGVSLAEYLRGNDGRPR